MRFEVREQAAYPRSVVFAAHCDHLEDIVAVSKQPGLVVVAGGNAVAHCILPVAGRTAGGGPGAFASDHDTRFGEGGRT